MTMNKNIHITEEQKSLMVRFIEEHPIMVRHKFTTSLSKENVRKLWEEVRRTLNRCNGPKKTCHQWKRSWGDLRRSAKVKDANIKKEFNGTKVVGTFQSEKSALSSLDKRILDIISDDTILEDPLADTDGDFTMLDEESNNPSEESTVDTGADFCSVTIVEEQEADDVKPVFPTVPRPGRSNATTQTVAPTSSATPGNRVSHYSETARAVDTIAQSQKSSLGFQERIAIATEASMKELKRQADALEALVEAYKIVHSL